MGLAEFRVAHRLPDAVAVNPASRRVATAALRTAAMTWADVPGAEPLGVFVHGRVERT